METTTSPIYLLVFGSLRATSPKGYNYERFGPGTQKHLKTFHLDGYEMYSLGPYPAVCEGEGVITVELHEVTELAARAIDMMEIGAGYTATPVKLVYAGEVIHPIIYTQPKESLRYRTRVVNGDWGN